jgi:hypothetical protein
MLVNGWLEDFCEFSAIEKKKQMGASLTDKRNLFFLLNGKVKTDKGERFWQVSENFLETKAK